MMLFIIVTTFILLFLSLSGVSGTILAPLLVPIMSDYVPTSQRGKGSGLVVCAFNVGAAVGYAIVGEIFYILQYLCFR